MGIVRNKEDTFECNVLKNRPPFFPSSSPYNGVVGRIDWKIYAKRTWFRFFSPSLLVISMKFCGEEKKITWNWSGTHYLIECHLFSFFFWRECSRNQSCKRILITNTIYESSIAGKVGNTCIGQNWLEFVEIEKYRNFQEAKRCSYINQNWELLFLSV